MVRNLYDRSFAGLFTPLDHRQYAPPLYLVAAKACGELFGYGERSLRLPALLGGLLAVMGLWWAVRTLKLGWWGLLPLGLLFVNPTVLRYVAEVKPYALDLGLAAIFLAWGLARSRPGWWFAVAGAVAIWASLPLIFVLAALGLYRFLPLLFGSKHRTGERAQIQPWLLTGALWLGSFALLYWQVLAPSVGTKYLNVYHGDYFFPLPTDSTELLQAGKLTLGFLRLAFGFTGLALAIGVVIFFSAAYHRSHLWLLLPLALVVLASIGGYYSLLPRLLLFTLPGWWLLAGVESARTNGKIGPMALLAWLMILGGTNVAQHFVKPQVFSDSRRLVLETKPGYEPVLHHGAVPAWDYYHRIHPDGNGLVTPANVGDVRELPSPDRTVLLYDVLTQGNIRESVRQDSIWAAERGCRVKSVAMFRAKALYLDCPED